MTHAVHMESATQLTHVAALQVRVKSTVSVSVAWTPLSMRFSAFYLDSQPWGTPPLHCPPHKSPVATVSARFCVLYTSLCFYVLRAFLPSLPGRRRCADLVIKTPPVRLDPAETLVSSKATTNISYCTGTVHRLQLYSIHKAKYTRSVYVTPNLFVTQKCLSHFSLRSSPS